MSIAIKAKKIKDKHVKIKAKEIQAKGEYGLRIKKKKRIMYFF